MNTIQTVAKNGVFNSGVMKGRRYRIMARQCEFVPEIWDMIKDYAGINEEGRFNLALKNPWATEDNLNLFYKMVGIFQKKESIETHIRNCGRIDALPENVERGKVKLLEIERQLNSLPFLGREVSSSELFEKRLKCIKIGDFIRYYTPACSSRIGEVIQLVPKLIVVNDRKKKDTITSTFILVGKTKPEGNSW